MLTVIVKSARQYIMRDDDWEWLQANYNVPLLVAALSFNSKVFDGSLWSISIYRDLPNGKVTAVTLFLPENGVEFELRGDIPCLNS